jgi:hypothetical protein
MLLILLFSVARQLRSLLIPLPSCKGRQLLRIPHVLEEPVPLNEAIAIEHRSVHLLVSRISLYALHQLRVSIKQTAG